MPRRVRAHEPSDSEADVRGHDAAVASGSRPLKRRRITSPFVRVVQTGDQRLVAQISQYLHPEDVLALSFTCRYIRSLLREESSDRIWRQARANARGPAPPRCPNGLSQMAWTALLWQKKCCHCWARTTRSVDWGLRRRFCSDCKQKKVKSQANMKVFEVLSTDVFRLVPYSKVAGSGVKTHYYWAPELEDVYNALKELDERVKGGDPLAEEERTQYIADRKRYVDEVLDAVYECNQWEKQWRAKAQARLRKKVVKSCVDMGYDVADVEDVFREAKITEASVSDFKAFLKKYQPELDSRHGRRPLATVSSSELLRKEYRRLPRTQAGPAGWEALVPFGDILTIPEVRSLLKRVSADNVADLAKRIPAFVETWREDIEAQLLCTLPPPPKDVRKADAGNPERLKLASSVWRRGDNATPLTFPHMLLVPHVLCLERKYGELEYATTDGPWSMDNMEYDSVGAGVVREFCKLAFLNYSTATVTVLDHSALRLLCNLCRNAWPLVLTWRQAIKHLHEVHKDGGSGSWKPFPSTIAEPVATVEAGLEVWVCAVSDCTRSRKLRKVAEIEKHIEDNHAVGKAIQGEHYIRAPTLPLSEPLTLLELFAKVNNEPIYECGTCDRSASLDRMMQHLQSRHALYSGSTSGPDSSSESDAEGERGHSIRRAISISSSPAEEAALARASQELEKASAPAFKLDASLVVQHSLVPSPKDAESKSVVVSAGSRDICPDSLRTTTLTADSRRPTIQEGGAVIDDEPVDTATTDPYHQALPRSPLVSPRRMSLDVIVQRDPITSVHPNVESRGNENVIVTSDEDEEDIGNLLSTFESMQKPASRRTHVADARATRASTSVISSATDLPFYSCMRCPRAVDRQRLYKLPVLVLHLAKRFVPQLSRRSRGSVPSHSLGAPVLGDDYALVPHDVDQSLLPWSQQKVYSCGLCESGSLSAPKRLLRWSEIDSHLVMTHKVVDPVGGRDYHRHPPEPPSTVDVKSAEHGVGIHVPGQAPEPEIDRVTLGNALQDVLKKAGVRVNSRIWKAFRCCRCSDGRLLHALGVLQHLASKHRNTHPTYGVDYVMDPIQREDALAKRFQCKVCSPSARRTFITSGIHDHLKSIHGLEVHEYEVHYIRAPPKTRDESLGDSGDESSSEDSDVEASDKGKTLKRRRKPNNRDTRQHRCNLCSDDDETYHFAVLRRHLEEEHDVTNPVFREHFEPVRTEDGRPLRKKLRARRE